MGRINVVIFDKWHGSDKGACFITNCNEHYLMAPTGDSKDALERLVADRYKISPTATITYVPLYWDADDINKYVQAIVDEWVDKYNISVRTHRSGETVIYDMKFDYDDEQLEMLISSDIYLCLKDATKE